MTEADKMAVCPLIQKDCLKDNCEWWSSGISKCGVIGIGMLLEGLHDMGAMTYQEFMEPLGEDEEVVNE
jgi:hypothetical protein